MSEGAVVAIDTQQLLRAACGVAFGRARMAAVYRYLRGIDPTTEAHDRFTVRYYIVAMLFLIFDVETIFLLPWAIIFMGDDFSFTKFALIEMFVFIGILVVGYYYAWRKGALEWA